jgi:6-phosphogluconolactonase (cycloisomerase 2 family)
LAVISPSVPTTESSACWVVVSGSGRFAYTANTGSGSISGFSVAVDGRLGLLTPGGVTGVTGPDSSPADLAMALFIGGHRP